MPRNVSAGFHLNPQLLNFIGFCSLWTNCGCYQSCLPCLCLLWCATGSRREWIWGQTAHSCAASSKGSPPRVARLDRRYKFASRSACACACASGSKCVCSRTTKPRAPSSTVATGAAERSGGERERQQTEDGRTRSPTPLCPALLLTCSRSSLRWPRPS